MKFLTVTLVLAAMLASATMAAASESLSDVHAPAVRRSMHHQKRKQCAPKSSSSKSHHSTKSHKTHKSKETHKAHKSSSAKSDKKKSSTDNDSSASKKKSSHKSSKSKSSTAGSGKDLRLGSKKGLAWPNAGGISIKDFLADSVSWYYSWSASPGWDSAPTDIAFCPMLWGHGSDKVADWKKHVVNNPNGKYNKHKCMLGPNEVNLDSQSGMSVGETCSLLRKEMMPLADQGWYFIGPSTTSAPTGLTQWYKNFKNECSDVFDRLDAISLHWYGTSIEQFKKYVTDWHQQMGKPLWITEFACTSFVGGSSCSKSDATQMMREMSEWFDSQDHVVAYSPFGTMQSLHGVSESNRLSQGSTPTQLFRVFADS